MEEHQEPVDLRVRRTHKLLWEALLALMVERDFEAIRVKDICDRAMVHRTTFYTHYTDKFDLLAHGIQQVHQSLLAEMDNRPKDAEAFTHFFTFIADNASFYRMMLGVRGVGNYRGTLQEYFASTFLAEKAIQTGSVPHALQAHFYAGAIVSAISWWLFNDMPCSAQQMGDYLRSLLGITSYRGR